MRVHSDNLGKTTHIVFACLVSFLVAGCAAQPKDIDFPQVKIYTPKARIDLQDEEGNAAGQGEQRPEAERRVEYIEGTGSFVAEAGVSQNIQFTADGGVSLTFKNTDIRVILRAVLADTLGISYTVDPRVQGSTSLETSGSISEDALRVSLEALLRTQGYALVPTSDGYFVLPVSEAPINITSIKHSIPASANLPGFSVHVVSLKYTRPSEIRRILEPLSPAGGILVGDDDRGILILAGTAQEISSMLHAVHTFDVDRMKGMSFGLYRLNYVDPEQIIDELTEIFKSGGANSISPVQFIPISRINKLIAVAPNRDLLKTVEKWVKKLDLGESAPGRRIYVYQVKNGRAADLASTLNAVLDTNSAGSVLNIANATARTTGRRNARPNSRNVSDRSSAPTFGGNGVRIVPSRENNSLVIMAAPSEFAAIEAAIKKIDLAPKQVLVEVTLAEVTLTDELRYGLQWHFEFGDNSVSFGSVNDASASQTGFSWSHNNLSNVNAILTALESVTDVKVISSPKILVLNNQSATLQVGDEVPVLTTSSVSTNNSNSPIVNNIEYRNTGVILTVTPRISEDGLVILDVEQEVSNVVETASSGIDAPTIQQRRMTTTVVVQNGSTIALGGLIRSTVSRSDSGVPFLKDIPILGAVFKNGGLVERRSELIILLTPRIIQNTGESKEVMDYIREEFRAVLGPPQEETNVE